jgi:hypothetical protein
MRVKTFPTRAHLCFLWGCALQGAACSASAPDPALLELGGKKSGGFRRYWARSICLTMPVPEYTPLRGVNGPTAVPASAICT